MSKAGKEHDLMSENVIVDLTKRQRDILLRGLRYVRSSLILDVHDPDPKLNADRENQLQQIQSLVDRLNGVPASRETSKVS